MDGVDVCNLGGGDDGGDVEVALGGARRADADGLVGKLDVQAVPVRLAVDGDGADAHLLARADDTQGDLTTVCDQNLMKHVPPLFDLQPQRLD